MIRFRSRGEAASDAQGCGGLIITKLPETEQHHPAWMAAVEALILVAETDGPTMFVRIGVMRALNRHVERVFDPTRKEPHWGRRKLARDR